MTLIQASIITPPILLAERMFTIWPIAAGLFVDFFFVRYATNLRGWRCLGADLFMNLTSLVLGILVTLLSGFFVEYVLAFGLNPLLNLGRFDVVTWGATVIPAAGVNTAIEGFVLRLGFQQILGKRVLWLLLSANLVSVSIAFASLFILPPG